ncbi:MAG: MFS transporter [Bacteroidetes bacterium]|jgi:POT family proton-dependent oligopeptide transporter|nr:MFS transporter [Bacteroidota bacterium]
MEQPGDPNGSEQYSHSFFGHPRGLATLFLTELWERFSYYGMRAILVLFMVDAINRGGLGLDDTTATAIYGLYTMFVYLLALPGGWLADKFLGLRNAIWYGGIIITAGHFSMAIPGNITFYLGLVLIVIGTGLLKPNISSIVGALYGEDEQARRDAGFSIFYMGINIGAFIAPLVTGYLGEGISWHYGFGAAGVGMLLGLIQYKLTEKYLGTIGLEPEEAEDPAQQQRLFQRIKKGLWVTGALLAALFASISFGWISIDPVAIADASGIIIFFLVIAYFVYVYIAENLNEDEKKKIGVIAALFIFSAIFWSGFEQAGSSLNLFAERYTDREIFGWLMPASWLQSVNPIFIITLAPVFGWLWVWLAKKNMEPSTPVKFALGLIFLGLGFLVMMFASFYVVGGNQVLPTWLIMTYLLHTTGELCLSPVGLSAVTKLAPKKLVGQMMGIWFMSIAFGNLIAGRIAGQFNDEAIQADPNLLPDLFWLIVMTTVGGGLLLLFFSKPIRKLMGNIH